MYVKCVCKCFEVLQHLRRIGPIAAFQAAVQLAESLFYVHDSTVQARVR